MRKVTGYIILVVVTIVMCCTSVVRARDNVFCMPNIDQTEQFLVSIARPLQDESTYKDNFKICGSAKMDNIRIRLYIRSESDGRYIRLKNSRGETYWDVGKSGLFIKEAALPKKGVNIVRVCAYDKRQEHNLEIGKNLQVNEFNIISLNKEMKDTTRGKIFGSAKEISRD